MNTSYGEVTKKRFWKTFYTFLEINILNDSAFVNTVKTFDKANCL